MYRLTYDQLLADLYQAYLGARRHKRSRPYQQRFERHLEENLSALCKELWNRSYIPRPSTCFIITDPKKREVFAADFRDRIVHHLYYNYVHELFERTFIADSYSCIKGRGTHYGIHRLEHHIRQESQNYHVPCYVLKMDIRGYFMSIDRERLLAICMERLNRMSSHRVNAHCPVTWQDWLDMDFVRYLTREIVLLDPTAGCRRIGNANDWAGLSRRKSLFSSRPGCGLPIGNLTSQLFSNVYLSVLDDYMKRELHCRHYGRYVDDFYIVSADRKWLSDVPSLVSVFLQTQLGLTLHEGKSRLTNADWGVEYLGAYLKPWRNYVSHATLRRMLPKMWQLPMLDDARRFHSRASLIGVLSHYVGQATDFKMLLSKI